ncbi:MAG: hypothetical protein ACI84O_000079 [Myxococcota bacterium]|jgi:hypothetical protein
MPSVTDLFSSHDTLVECLTAHKRAVVLGRMHEARQSFQEFWVAINAHSMCEDELLLPKFVQLGLETNGCTAALLSKEHIKLRRLADEARARVNEPVSGLTAERRIYLLENLHMLSEVLEHHDARERAAFLCKFDEVLSEVEATELHAAAQKLELKLAASLSGKI